MATVHPDCSADRCKTRTGKADEQTALVQRSFTNAVRAMGYHVYTIQNSNAAARDAAADVKAASDESGHHGRHRSTDHT